jgi:hypothetical protein
VIVRHLGVTPSLTCADGGRIRRPACLRGRGRGACFGNDGPMLGLMLPVFAISMVPAPLHINPLCRLRGGSSATASAPPAASFSVALHESALHVTDDMYPSRFDRTPILDGISADFAQATSSPTGGLFLHTSHEATHERTSSLGKLRCHRLLASARVTRYWMGPSFGRRALAVPHDSQFLYVTDDRTQEISRGECSDANVPCSILRSSSLVELEPDGPYALLLPLVDQSMRATLHGAASPWQSRASSRGDELLLHVESGDTASTATGMRALYVAVGDDPFALLRRGFGEVAEALGTFRTLEHKQLPASVESFGWCTWDAFYSSVSPEGVLAGVSALRSAGVPPRTLILDDGWQRVEPALSGEADGADGTTLTQAAEGERRNGANVFSAVGSSIGAALLRGLTALLAAFYERCVRRASPNALAPAVWRMLINSVLKPNMWSYFEEGALLSPRRLRHADVPPPLAVLARRSVQPCCECAMTGTLPRVRPVLLCSQRPISRVSSLTSDPTPSLRRQATRADADAA